MLGPDGVPHGGGFVDEPQHEGRGRDGMKHEPLSGASAFPRRRRGRTLVEPLEARLLYSADVTTVTAPSLSPLLCGTGVAQVALLGSLANRQVEVATVQATGSVGPSVR